MSKISIERYAEATASDISSVAFGLVEDGELKRYFAGTVFGNMVSTVENGHKFKHRDQAEDNARIFVSQCRDALGVGGPALGS